MRLPAISLHRLAPILLSVAFSPACGDEPSVVRPDGRLDFEPARPALMAAEVVPEYTGADPYVLEAQNTHRTGLELHRNVIIRTCGPTGGVCHNQKEYPDLHTPSNLLAAINAPCNIQPGDYAAVFDGCEPVGDRFRIDGQTKLSEIGFVEFVPGETSEGGDANAETPGLHVYLKTALSTEYDRNELWGEGHFLRNFTSPAGEIEELMYARFQTSWRLLDGGTHLFAQVREYQADQVNELLSVGIEQGDMNRNGVFGASEARVAMLKPGAPEESYLIGRLRGAVGPAGAERDVPGTRMPLANDPLTIADMLALYCFVEGLPLANDGVLDLEGPIDYVNCSYSANPEALNLLGKGATWLGRVQPLLSANCGGCHGGTEPQAGLDLESEGVYERLLQPSVQNPAMPFITPGDPTNSYLWLKLNATAGDGTISGLPMPIDPLTGTRRMSEGALLDIQTWITNGALAED